MMANIVKAIWGGVSLFVLVVTLSSYDGKQLSDIWIFLTWLMLIISFPAGLAVSAAHYVLGAAFSITVETSYLSLALEWFVYFVLGYVQWFVLLPWLWRKWKARRAGGAAPSV
ncbi:hypothetical protein JLK41_22100 [Ectopseudomonas khazarica]|uniref:hypothetical protein n=1 Tax=Ectopseudomonas khazarica TaxID=2502979 RepID=UPI001AEF724C|nr:hypothetical protein [Pseudomonas khazarica]QTS85974.1 hypothetical protein JLK41_22100 [Pseudomonas khazarica]